MDPLTDLAPNLESLDTSIGRRVAMTVSCRDADHIDKVRDAGTIREEHGKRVQVMHNGVLVEAGGYYGDWMAEIIRCLRGHHEPQEEVVFDEIVRRLATEGMPATMIEFGSFWTYYGLWFCRSIPEARAIAVEPDPAYLEVGRRNAALNQLDNRVTFKHAAVGVEPEQDMQFRAESDGRSYTVPQCDLGSVLSTEGLDRVDLVLADVQGAETTLLLRGADLLRAGKVRFLIVSTHHHSISGDPLTHQSALRMLLDLGAHVVCEHSVPESFSGDGLIAVSFHERDRDLIVQVSRARSKDSLLGELEFDVAERDAQLQQMAAEMALAKGELSQTRAELTRRDDDVNALRVSIAEVESERDTYQAQLDGVYATKLWRWSRRPRDLYGRLRSP
jgi:FkbM family methyltransferase